MTNLARVVEVGEDNLLYARYTKPLSEKAATSRKFWKVKERSFPVENRDGLSVKAGDFVEISIKTGLTIGAAFLVFMVPLILFASLYGVGGLFFKGEGPRALLGLAGLAVGLIIPAFVNLLQKEKNYPLLEKVLTPEEFQQSLACNSDCAACGGCG
ncbi:MAG: SoxR reducing system RseC family protein [Spirochaetales bacterium]|nr:SoxR reducing system RseC family protein [Spirochaetales bacterium]